MDSIEPFIAWLLVAACFGAAVIFAWQQVTMLRRLRAEPPLPTEEHTYFRRQAIRRLVGCGLLVAIGGLIAGSYVSGQEAWVAQLKSPSPVIDQGAPALDPDLQQRKRAYVWYWITVLLLLLALVIVAALDFLAIRGYGARHLRRLYADRKAMLERELAELRRARGHRNGQP